VKWRRDSGMVVEAGLYVIKPTVVSNHRHYSGERVWLRASACLR
jgi:hypothetical protein